MIGGSEENNLPVSLSVHRPSVRAGFTLIELLAAIVILALIVSSLLTVRNNSIREAQQAKNARLAWSLGRSKYSELQIQARKGTTLDRSGTFSDHEKYRWELRSEKKVLDYSPSPGELLEKKDGDSLSRRKIRERRQMRFLTLTIFFPDPASGNEKQINLTMVLFPKTEEKSGGDKER